MVAVVKWTKTIEVVNKIVGIGEEKNSMFKKKTSRKEKKSLSLHPFNHNRNHLIIIFIMHFFTYDFDFSRPKISDHRSVNISNPELI